MAPVFTGNHFGFGVNKEFSEPPQIEATGGSKSGPTGGYYIHTFTSSGSLTVTSGKNSDNKLLVVAGGGAGAYNRNGGGGGGGVIYLTDTPDIEIETGTYPVTVGSGSPETEGQAWGTGGNGQNSSALGYTATGGGAGTSPGGSGGGITNSQPTNQCTGTGPGHPGSADAETPGPIASAGGWGNPGGLGWYCGHAQCTAGGGGGGARTAGEAHTYGPNPWAGELPTGGSQGGNGAEYTITGSPYTYSGGGGGGLGQNSNTPTCTGGNGNGGGGQAGRSPGTCPQPGFNSKHGTDATTYGSGGGGGGGYQPGSPFGQPSAGKGGAGGNGIVVICYPDGS